MADRDRNVVRKQAWTTARLHDGVPPGRAITVDDQVVGVAVFACVRDVACSPSGMPGPSDDALVLATVWLDPLHRGAGLGRLLVQEAVKQAIALGLESVEVRADRRYRPDQCVLPITWLLHEGFEVVQEHPRWPLLRLEVARTVRWTDSVELAVEGVRGLLPKATPAPKPAVDAVADGFTPARAGQVRVAQRPPQE